jgi:hypothetical protein
VVNDLLERRDLPSAESKEKCVEQPEVLVSDTGQIGGLSFVSL